VPPTATPKTSHVTSPASLVGTSQVTTAIVAMHHLVGAAEIGRLLGVSRQRVQQLVNRDDFPEPEAVLEMGKVWKRSDVEEWARSRGRQLKQS
jgi:predicted DNA-binding transcriptional regulator AlpA